MTNEREPLWIPTPDEIAALRRTLEQQDKRIAELEARLAQTWQPLPDGEYNPIANYTINVYSNGTQLEAWAGDIDRNTVHELSLLNYRLCRLVDEPRYSHRNGETEPPTVRGFYWLHQDGLDGDVVHVVWQKEIRYRGKVDIREGWIISGEIDHYVDELADAQWYGPIVPPWEVDHE